MLARAVCRADSVSHRVVVGRSTNGACAWELRLSRAPLVADGLAVHLLEAGQGIEYVADHLGHKNIQNTRIYAQITTSLRQEVFAKLERHPKIVMVL
jgi:site-specific recombinase XerC